MRQLTVIEAFREALRQELNADPEVFVMGEDARIGGSFLLTLGLVDEFGHDRIIDTPISETGFIGLAIGASMMGLRPVVDLQYGDFAFCAMEQIAHNAAKLRYASGGQVSIPAVLHFPTGASGRGATHAQSMETYFAHLPGLKVAVPATPYDAKGLMHTAIRDDNFCIISSHKLLYGSKGRKLVMSESVSTDVPEEPYAIPFGSAEVKRAGTDVTVVATLLMLHRVLDVARELELKEGISVEVVDPRTLVPLDRETIVTSVQKTGRLVIVEEDTFTYGWGAEVAASVATDAIGYLDAPIVRIATPDVPMPAAPNLEGHLVPSAERIQQGIFQVLGLQERA
jgi:pyruvate/2-oxoglutarate/acetoin dehydrogenase E1 component